MRFPQYLVRDCQVGFFVPRHIYIIINIIVHKYHITQPGLKLWHLYSWPWKVLIYFICLFTFIYEWLYRRFTFKNFYLRSLIENIWQVFFYYNTLIECIREIQPFGCRLRFYNCIYFTICLSELCSMLNVAIEIW